MMKDTNSAAMKTVHNPVLVWEEKFRKDTLTGRDFREFWKLRVPNLYAPHEKANFSQVSLDDSETQKVFFEPLKQFMFSENYNETLKHLKALATPTSLCGRVFRMGEATYSCRDCGQDSTCVLCRDCFKASVHQQHRYKMNQSVGGGYCDCGDREAWREAAACSIHTNSGGGGADGEAGMVVASAAAALAKFPRDIVARARAVFAAVLEYALEMLTPDNLMRLPRDLHCPSGEYEMEDDELLAGGEDFTPPPYATIFYNDETHTFDQVIECLRKAVGCTQREAVEYATLIDRVGRCIVKCGDFQTCNRAKQVSDSHSSRHYTRPYKVQLMHTHVVAHQLFAMRLLVWLKRLIEEVDGFKTLFAQIVAEPSPGGSLVERVMRGDIQLWKQARNQWHLLLIQGMLMENDSKKVFAKTFTRLYPNLMQDFMSDDHNHSDSITSLSVQIYTVPTLAYMLITSEDCLHVVTRTFHQECRSRLNNNGVLSFDANSSDFSWRRINYCLNDLRYLLSVRPRLWDDSLRSGFLHGFSAVLDVLAVMEGMDASLRQTGSHLEFDPEWQTAFTLFGKLSMVIGHLIDWCSSDRIVMVKTYQALLRKLYTKLTPERVRPSAQLTVAGKQFRVVNFDMWQAPVSLHLPLTRLLPGLHVHLARFGLAFDCAELAIDNRPTIQQIMEMSLRAVVLTTQVRAGMWRRNGTSLNSQVHFYSNVRIRSEIQDRDIQVLQMAAALEDPDEFVMTVLHRYNLHHWLADDFEAKVKSNTGSDGECLCTVFAQSIQDFVHNLEEALLVFIHVFGERYQPGIGLVTKEDCIRKEIIQVLCIEPSPHSRLCKLVMAENQEVSIEELAGQVGRFCTPAHSSGKGVYEIKPEFLADYNPFWYHYTREEQSRAEGAQRRRKVLAGEAPCLPPPMFPPFTAEFHCVRNIATCAAMVNVIRTVLLRAADLQARVFSETLVHRALFFMGMALNEERRQTLSPTSRTPPCTGFATPTTPVSRTAAAAAADSATTTTSGHVVSPNAPLDLRVTPRSSDPASASSTSSSSVSSSRSPGDQQPLDLSFCFSQLCQHAGLLELLDHLSGSARVSSHADLLGWVSCRLAEQLGLPVSAAGAAAALSAGSSLSSSAAGAAAAARASVSTAAAIQKRRADVAARNARIMRKMQQQQHRFSRQLASMQASAAAAAAASMSPDSLSTKSDQSSSIAAANPDASLDTCLGSSVASSERLAGSSMDVSEAGADMSASGAAAAVGAEAGAAAVASCAVEPPWPVCVGVGQTARCSATVRPAPGPGASARSGGGGGGAWCDFTCILCQASETGAARLTMVLAALVQPSTVLSRRLRRRAETGTPLPPPATATAASTAGATPPPPPPPWSRLLLDSELHRLPFISSCGHAMHATCWKRHFDNACQRERRRALRLTQNNVFDVSKHEFLCPLCQCLSNTVIPLVPPRVATVTASTTSSSSSSSSSAISRQSPALADDVNGGGSGFDAWIEGLQLICQHSTGAISCENLSQSATTQCTVPELHSLLQHMSPAYGKQFEYLASLGDCVPDMSNTTIELINAFTMVPIMVDGDGEQVQFGDARLPLLTLHALAYTLHATEHQVRHQGRPLLASLGSRSDICLQQLVHLSAVMLPAVADRSTGRVCALSLLRPLLAAGAAEGGGGGGGVSLLQVDALGALVAMCALLPALFCRDDQPMRAPSGSQRDHHCLRLCLLLHLVQIVAPLNSASQLWQGSPPPPASSSPPPTATGSDANSAGVQQQQQQPAHSGVAMETDAAADDDHAPHHRDDDDVSAAEAGWLQRLYETVRGVAALPVARDVGGAALWRHVRRAVTPFLRCAALYLHLLSGVPTPGELHTSLWHDQSHDERHVTLLLRYLGLTSLCVPVALQPNTATHRMLLRWCGNSELQRACASPHSLLVQYPLAVNTLVPLPEDFSELINKVSDFTCPSSAGESRVPAMCLACGQLLCSQSYCCQAQVDQVGQIGACNAHLIQCGASIGAMLRIRECRVHLLVNKVRGAHYTPPYVDKFGEVDQGLQRGNPLTLWRQQYERLNRLWMTHGIAEEVTRQMEEAFSYTDWQNH